MSSALGPIFFAMCHVLCALLVRRGAGANKDYLGSDTLSSITPSAETARREAFSRGLRELGYVEGKTIIIEHRYSEGNYNRLAGLATELVRLKPDLIVPGGHRLDPRRQGSDQHHSHCDDQ